MIKEQAQQVRTHLRFFAYSMLRKDAKNYWEQNPKPSMKTEVNIKANRKRKIVLCSPVTEEERKLIEQKMAQLPTNQSKIQ